MRKQIKVEGCINDSNIKTEISHAPIGFSIKPFLVKWAWATL